MKRFGSFAVLFVAIFFASARTLRADAIVFTSLTGGTYGYGLSLDAATASVEVQNGDTVMFTGLSGVTGASASVFSGYTATFTSTSVTFTEVNGPTFANNPGKGEFIFPDLFLITSSNSMPGTVFYASTSSLGVVGGPIEGPVAIPPPPGVVPEPSSLILMGSGLLGALGAVRRKFVQ